MDLTGHSNTFKHMVIQEINDLGTQYAQRPLGIHKHID